MRPGRLLVALLTALGTLSVATVASPVQDHYKCYRARTKPFTRRTVGLIDEFAVSTASIVSPLRFCNPADKNGEGIDDPTAHLMCYQIREAPFTRRTVSVRNQFGDQSLTVVKPESLCNPAEKDGVTSPLQINHYKCYRAVGVGFVPQTVGVADQFETQSATLLRARLFCTPVDKNGEGIVDPAAHLTCYTIQSGDAFTPRMVSVVDQFAEQDFTTLRGDCRKRSLLCVPSEKDPSGTTSTSVSSSTSTSSSTTTDTLPAPTSTSTSTSTTESTSTTTTSTSSSSTSTLQSTTTTTPIDNTTTTTEPAICGNGRREEGEDCDPPASACSCPHGPDGICSDDCFCLFCLS